MNKNQKVYPHKLHFFQELNEKLGTNIDIVQSITTAPYYFFLKDGSLYTALNFTEMLHNLNDVYDLGIDTRASYSARDMLVIFEDFDGLLERAEKIDHIAKYSDAEWLNENLSVEEIKKYFGDKGIEVPTKFMKKENLISYFLLKEEERKASEEVQSANDDIKTVEVVNKEVEETRKDGEDSPKEE